MRDVLKGLSDTLENLLDFTVLSLLWWLALVLIVPGPGATIALLHATDPRLVHATERPSFRELAELTRRFLSRGWEIALISIPLLVIPGYNLWAYRDERGMVMALAPLWTVLLVAIAAIGTIALAVAALFDDEVGPAIRRACGMVARRPLAATGMMVALAVLLLLSAMLVIPLIMLYPAMAAVIVNRFVLRTLGIPVPDSLDPTAERLVEEERERSARRFGP